MKHRRVLIDGYFLGKPYGFGRFIFELCRALGNTDADHEFVVAVPGNVDPAELRDYSNVRWHRLPRTNFIFWEQLVIPRLARRLSCDVIHFPYNTKAFWTAGITSVTTVHDLLFLHEHIPPTHFKDLVRSRYSRLVFKRATRRSSRVVAVSDTTRRELATLGIQSKTVYNTVDGFLSASRPPGEEPPIRPFVLHRGGPFEHRNTKRVIEAFRSVRSSLGEVDLKIVGAPDGAERWHTTDDRTIEYLPQLSDRDLATLYVQASCVMATSLREGFGLPIIEAFGFGTPVVTSNIDPMKEIAGDAALLVDPYSTEEISQALHAILTDPLLSTSLIEKGRERVKAFGSCGVAEKMIAIYEA